MLISSPPGTDKYIANGSTPILILQRPATLINSNFKLPFRHIFIEGTAVNGFILNCCEIKVLSVQVRDTKYGGNLYDRQQDNISKWPCYQMINRTENVIVTGEVVVTLEDGSSFTASIRSK